MRLVCFVSFRFSALFPPSAKFSAKGGGRAGEEEEEEEEEEREGGRGLVGKPEIAKSIYGRLDWGPSLHAVRDQSKEGKK